MTESTDSPGGDDVVARCHLDTGGDAPAIQLVGLVADLEDADPMDLDPLYSQIDDLLDALFDSPPAAAADAELEFNYEEYRITLRQNGAATIRRSSS